MPRIHIQMLGGFALYVGEERNDELPSKTPKGVALMQLLLTRRGENVANADLLALLWSDERSENPENALKTLISRMRAMMNGISPDFGKCIASKRGFYTWESGEDVFVDYYRALDLLEELEKGRSVDAARRASLTEELIAVYQGDLLADENATSWAHAQAVSLRKRYKDALIAYIEQLKYAEDYEQIVFVCRAGLNIDSFDETLHMELMNALTRTGKPNEAMNQYKHVSRMYRRYLDDAPSEKMTALYRSIAAAGKELDDALENIRTDLTAENGRPGAYVCEYSVFREVFELQRRSLERIGASIFLGLISIEPEPDAEMSVLKQDNIMQGLIQLLRGQLRKGDTVTQYSPNTAAVLLPTVNFDTGHMIMNRIRREFYRKYPNSDVTFNFRIGPLSGEVARKERT